MKLEIIPGKSLTGHAEIPGDKSISHRAALLGALAEGKSRIEHFLNAGVTEAMLSILKQSGVSWQRAGERLEILGRGWRGLLASPNALDCGNSGTTMRLLAGALSAANIPAVLDGSAGLRIRPMKRIVVPLSEMGVDIEAADGCAPLKIYSSKLPLKGIFHEMPVASAQVKSCLLLAALAADTPCTIIEPGPSRDHTELMLKGMGISIEKWTEDYHGQIQYFTRLTPNFRQSLSPLNVHIPGDFSAAAFLLVAGAVTPGSCITMKGVGLNATRIGLLEVLQEMGAEIQITNETIQGNELAGDLMVRHSGLHGIDVSGSAVVRMIDEFPVFAVAASFAKGKTVVHDADELRHKESDRITSLGRELIKLGVDFTETADGFIIRGNQVLGGAQVDAHGDHRIAMALTVAGLASLQPVTVSGAEYINESFPDFVPCLQRIGANLISIQEKCDE